MAVDSRPVNPAPAAPAPPAAVPPAAGFTGMHCTRPHMAPTRRAAPPLPARASAARGPAAPTPAAPTLAITAFTLAITVLSLVTLSYSCSPPGDHPAREGRAVRTADRAARATPDAAPSRPDETAASPSTRTALITRVIDGDTVVLESGERVRYIGIDTPELRGAPEVVALGRAAAEHNRQLVEGKTARLVPDTRRRDRYGRLLAYVYIDTLFVNARMIADGYALAYTVPPDVKHAELFRALEREAREQRRGLWGESPGLGAVERRVTAPRKRRGSLSLFPARGSVVRGAQSPPHGRDLQASFAKPVQHP